MENIQKESVISEYTEHLSEDLLNSYREKFSEYTSEELDMRLAYELKKAGITFSKKQEEGYIPKEVPITGISAILSKYKKV